MDEATQKASQDGTSPLTKLDVWRETVEVKKGRIYGLSLEFTVINGRLYYRGSVSQSSTWVQRAEHEELLKRMTEENSALLARLESNEKQLQATNQLVQQMMQWMNFQPIDLQPTIGDQAEDEGASDDGEEFE